MSSIEPDADTQNDLHIIVQGLIERFETENDDNADLFEIGPKARANRMDFVDGRYIPESAIPMLTHLVVDFVAELIQEYIDAGSERDVTFEDEKLYDAIKEAFTGWGKR